MQDLENIKKLLDRDGRLIRLPAKGKAVFVGDTHGDFEATETVFRLYFKPGHTLIFLGDYVDRGKHSRENIEFLLRKKIEAPKQVFLLMGNHEAYSAVPFYPADFWESLSIEEHKYFSEVCQFLSFSVVTENGIIGLHGIPPDVHELEEIKDIQYGSQHWHQVTWGDFVKMPGDYLGNYGGRPIYGEDYFNRKMKEFKSNVLIRAHQPHIDTVVFHKHCLTLMTSHAYKPVRLIAIADLEKPEIRTVDELELREI